jgi:hypothetical protein
MAQRVKVAMSKRTVQQQLQGTSMHGLDMLKRLSVGIQKQYITASERRKDFHHLLHLRPKAGQHLNRWRRAAQYLEAGVKFKKRDYDKLVPRTLLDIRFQEPHS